MSIADESDLFGPDLSDQPESEIEVVEDGVEIWSAQFVNRWVFLKHQRPAALKELGELVEHVRKARATEPNT